MNYFALKIIANQLVNKTYNYNDQAFSITLQCLDDYLSATGLPIGQVLTTDRKLSEMRDRINCDLRNNIST